MPRKAKFRPEITRVKLNPEQAVLQCACFGYERKYATASTRTYYRWGTTGGVDICDREYRISGHLESYWDGYDYAVNGSALS